ASKETRMNQRPQELQLVKRRSIVRMSSWCLEEDLSPAVIAFRVRPSLEISTISLFYQLGRDQQIHTRPRDCLLPSQGRAPSRRRRRLTPRSDCQERGVCSTRDLEDEGSELGLGVNRNGATSVPAEPHFFTRQPFTVRLCSSATPLRGRHHINPGAVHF